MNKRWRVEIEVTFAPKEDESEHQALERAKASLNRMLDNETEINHYHILKRPHTCYEFD